MNDADFPDIKTGNRVDRDLAATANDRLKTVAIEINKLTKTIEVFNEQSQKQTEKMIRLTWWIVGLTVVMVIGLVIQIILSL